MRCKIIFILVGILLITFISAVSDTAVFQGQYYEGSTFYQGTYEFQFDIYTGEVLGDLVYSDTQTLTTGSWGEWRTELDGISAACNDTSKDYFMEITINNETQTPRRRLTQFNYLRKDVDETTTGILTLNTFLKFVSGGFLQELTNLFILNKNLQVQGDLNVTNRIDSKEIFSEEVTISGELNVGGEIKNAGKLVCLEDGTNCQSSSGGGSGNYVSFFSTLDGDLSVSDRYIPLGTDSLITITGEESCWVVGRNLTITGIVWNAASNSRTKNSVISLMKSTTTKSGFIETDLSKNIQGQVKGADNSYEINFAQGDLALIKYESGGAGGLIHDLSVTFTGHYN